MFAEKSNLPKYYFDLKKEKKSQDKDQTAYTPAISLIMGLAQSLRMLQDEGLEEIFRRHSILARGVREGISAMGLELFAKDSPSESVTAIKSPDGIDGQKVVKHLRTKYKVTIAGGQDRLKGKVFRIAHLGYYDAFDMIVALSAIEWTLRDLGYKNIVPGKGVQKAVEVFYEIM